MPVYIGQVTSEVYSAAPVAPPPSDQPPSMWEERLRIAGIADRIARDRDRTSTGGADD